MADEIEKSDEEISETFGFWANGKSFEEAKSDCKSYGPAIPAMEKFLGEIFGHSYDYFINECSISKDEIYVHCDPSGTEHISDIQCHIYGSDSSEWTAHGYLQVYDWQTGDEDIDDYLDCSMSELIEELRDNGSRYSWIFDDDMGSIFCRVQDDGYETSMDQVLPEIDAEFTELQEIVDSHKK